MANRASIAARSQIAAERIQSAMGRLSETSGVPVPPPTTFPYKQPELRQAAEMERFAIFMEKLAAGDTSDYPDANAPPEEAGEADGEGGERSDDEPFFAGKPLGWYAGKSDEDILSSPEVRVGEKTLAKIRAAEAERAG